MPGVDPLIGGILANYHIERLLGRGGMASVYYGYDFQLQRPAAIKVIDERNSNDPAYAVRFVHEARAMASWRHPNIPQIYQAGVEKGIYYYAMEYIPGMDLEEMLRRYAQKGELVPYVDILVVGNAVADALDFAHTKGAIHRDVKPSNVLISEDDRILLTDFGLVLEVDKGTRGEVFGSPQYIAPEQARNSADAVPQTDLYSLGVILYEMLTGKLPFEDPSPASLALKHIMLDPPAPRELNPELSPEVESVLLKALQKSPQDRYQTGKELMSALEAAIPKEPAEKRTLPVVPEPQSTHLSLSDESSEQPPSTLSEPTPSSVEPAGAAVKPILRPLFSPPVKTPAVASRPGLSSSSKGIIFITILLVSLLFMIGVSLLATIFVLGRLHKPSSTSVVQPSATAILAMVATPSPLAPTIAVVFAATGTPTAGQPLPTSTANIYNLSLSTQKAGTFVITNQGTVPLPFSQFSIGTQKNSLSGDDWGVDVLQPGQCVVVNKEDHGAPPSGVQCNIVGKALNRSPSNKFLDSQFNVYYQNIIVAVCDMSNDAPCILQFSPSP